MNTTSHGSRNRVLQLLESPDYLSTMNTLLQGRATLKSGDAHEPRGLTQSSECEIPRFCQQHLPNFDRTPLENWWLPQQPRTPKGATWDLLSLCEVDGKQGLLLVEAKAHEGELDFLGKELETTASTQSQINHKHITDCLSDASEALKKLKVKVMIVQQ